jgi:hypothetical protein
MTKRILYVFIFLMSLLIYSCSRKTHPSKTFSETTTSKTVTKNTESPVAAKPITKPKAKVALPKVIVVNDSAAHKSVDGRLYYDVMGHRYWRNNKDGKYYLYNKSMYNNPDFNKPG